MTLIRSFAAGAGIGTLTVSQAFAHPDSHAGVADSALLAHVLSDPYHVGALVALVAIAMVLVLAIGARRRRGMGVRGRRGTQ